MNEVAARRRLVLSARDALPANKLPALFEPAVWADLADYLGLSPRQIDIGRLICLGHSTKELAVSLGIATDTIRKHRLALYQKLGICDRVGVPVRLVVAERAMNGDAAKR